MQEEPLDIRQVEGHARARDARRLAAGEVTPQQLQRENALIQSAEDILFVDLSPKGTPASWARLMKEIERS